jgi:hypothetical protein
MESNQPPITNIRTFIESKLTLFIIIFIVFLFGLVSAPFVFISIPEENLVQLDGHLDNLSIPSTSGETSSAFTNEKHDLILTINEHKNKTFLLTGLRLSDQNLFEYTEKRGSWLTFSVNKDDFIKQTRNIKIYEISSISNNYISLGTSIIDAQKGKIFFSVFSVTSLSLGILGLIYLKRKYQHIPETTQATETMDPLMVFFAKKLTFLDPTWFNSIIERDKQKKAQLAERSPTTKPKYIRAIQQLLKRTGNVNLRDKEGRTPLFIAANKGELEAVGLLIKKGANVNLTNHANMTPLMTAAQNGHLGVVLRLLDAGAKIDLKNDAGADALSLATQEPKKNNAIIEVLSKLLQKEKKGTKTP